MKDYFLKHICQTLNLPRPGVAAAVELLEEGNTVPFVSRYRKEATGNLDEVALFDIEGLLARYTELEQRKATILRSIEEQGALTPELRALIEAEVEGNKLEDLYLPYKPRKRTRAQMAREKGLEPLADILMAQGNGDPAQAAEAFVTDQVADTEAALAGARDIVAERISEDAPTRDVLRRHYQKAAMVQSKVVKGKEEEGATYRDYFDFAEPARSCKPHRLMAMVRGESEGVLRVKMAVEADDLDRIVERRFVKGTGAMARQVAEASKDSCRRLLAPSMEGECLRHYKDIADQEAIRVFAANLRQLLMLPPAGEKRILGIDPGYRTGCKVVCIDAQGNLLHNDVIYPHPPKSLEMQAARKIHTLVEMYRVEMIAIGNGTASRETERFIASLRFRDDVQVYVVDESGASIYSASKLAREEFPDYDVTVRGAVSIARRLADPLSELIKIDPRSIGVGQYQHDVNQTRLQAELDNVVVSCVNRVGVNLNTASARLLSYVSGLGPGLAANIVEHRREHGPFADRASVLAVPRLGAKAFQQSAGFLRVPGAADPLDNSSVHPENYGVVAKMAARLGVATRELVGNAKLVDTLSPGDFVEPGCGEYTVRDILQELRKPGRDPRGKITSFRFDDTIKTIDDLAEGMILDGLVTNVTNFGAFVDIGIKQNGLVHVSEIREGYVKNPAEEVRVRQQVSVRVLSVDLERGRVALSMRGVE